MTKKVSISADGKEYKGIEELAPELSDWYCHPFGMTNINWTPLKGDTPNWWWRMWQYIFLGNIWRKV